MAPSDTCSSLKSGFTIIQISIVLVIIGLIIGAILTGKHLIDAAAISAQISQIDKYNTAVTFFQTKYNGYLPGDIPEPYATQFGFQPRGAFAGQGDGNGILEGTRYDVGPNWGTIESTGENPVFWRDLSTAGLIEGGFNTASTTTPSGALITVSSTPSLNDFLPAAKLGKGNYVFVWSTNGINYYGMDKVKWINGIPGGGAISTSLSIPVIYAYNIDKKTDDGLPQSGSVTAMYPSGGSNALQWVGAIGTGATPSSPATCYDNAGIGGATQQYSITQNSGNGLNCALSFQFQTQ